MGKELTKFKRRKEAQQRLEEIDAKREQHCVIHYSCESFYDIKDGRTPRITSIAIRNFATGQTRSFSIHKNAEQLHIAFTDISSHYDALEKSMLDEYFEYLKSQNISNFIHWNMRDINYGFQAIEHRYKVLGGVPYAMDDRRKIDLARELISLYGVSYVSHGQNGRLHSLLELNKITAKDLLNGNDEASAFENKEYIKLHQSTLRKVDVMSNILQRALDGSLKTSSSWVEVNGLHPKVIVELVQEHWAWTIVAIIIGTIGLASSIKGLV